uniref:alpha/beta fold hydrolase n=1 Tax=Streptomyces xanthophaeus TaxID=67385 RepID=UPI00233E6F69|nr:hypothetical protein [Streptomyces xanthophaeus]
MTAAEVPPIVFVHGTLFSAGQCGPQLAGLRKEFPVVAADLPGHGARFPVRRKGVRPRAHPHARVELIPRARHLADFDDPDAFSDAVRRFARQLPVRS